MNHKKQLSCALTIAGSDSGGGAGVQADLQTFAALGVHGVCAITAITAQNPSEVIRVTPVASRDVLAQLTAVLGVMKPWAAKTGMLVSERIVQTVAGELKRHPKIHLVVDPVMISTSGRVLSSSRAVQALCRELLPISALLTPNLAEASRLAGNQIKTVAEMRSAARLLFDKYGCPVLIKGGHLEKVNQAVDVFWNGREEVCFAASFVRGLKTHGTGCTLSAAITAFLAQGQGMVEAIRSAKSYLTRVLKQARKIGPFDVLRHRL